ncbi:PLP-dependent transferase [Pluteus cervinus]|uniref:PLP-dependent transferase n=1 Tax=Pluteus cervinus TaxID=181527 RepID=A0ACD3A7S3_9AGAR|nr:PLP-dependent transferase [Pluteus cervinus]
MSNILDDKLKAALASREERWIRRRLPDPIPSSSASSSSSPSTPILIDFNSNDYLSLSSSPRLRSHFLQKLSRAPDILGSGGSRLLVNGQAHHDLESRLSKFFNSPAALLFNSGFDANVGFFSCIPQQGDVVVYDEYVHASVHDGVRASRVRKEDRVGFRHNCVESLRVVLGRVKHNWERHSGTRTKKNSVFIAVESLYSMDGTFAPLQEIVEVMEDVFPAGNIHLVVDEAHSTGIYGDKGKGRVAMLGLEEKVLARLHTFGKALAATGAVILTSVLIRDYLLNYARSLIYTTSLNYANIIAADASFDMLEDGTAEQAASKLLNLSLYLIQQLQTRLSTFPERLISLPHHLKSLPPLSRYSHPQLHSLPLSPIIPIMTSHPRPLSSYLLALGMNARPITWPTVPKGKDRIRVCLHTGNTKEDLDRLVEGVVRWANEVLDAGEVEVGMVGGGRETGTGATLVASKL